MENQHRKITGYRELSQEEIDAMNNIKRIAEDVGDMLGTLANRPDIFDQRWVSIAKTDLQKGFMAAVRAIAQPTTF